ncbi:hypothetical protein KbCgl_30700 [Corynebacterium glutamicum]|nr:hypothetical protein KbCgl_30700 [Corynebacterium glutamicum]
MHELGGVHGVVGEQNVLLHVFHVDAGVVLDAGAGDVEALRTEVEKREFGAVESVPVAVDNCVVDFIQGGAWMISATSPARRASVAEGAPRMYSVGCGYLTQILNLAGIITGETLELFAEVTLNHAWFGQGGGVSPGSIHIAEGFGAVDGFPFQHINGEFGVNNIGVCGVVLIVEGFFGQFGRGVVDVNELRDCVIDRVASMRTTLSFCTP